MRKTGTYQKLGALNHFVPHPLPPQQPALALSPEMMALHGEVCFVLGQLDEMAKALPCPTRFVKAYVIKEALLSSEIGGVQTTLQEVFTNRISKTKSDKDTQLVLNYTQALESAFKLLSDDGMSLTSQVILQTHDVLMSDGHSEESAPGEYRKQSVRVGDFVPPPAPEVPDLISELEQYLNQPCELPALIQAGLAHVQFETIHPFLDGNGRIGRLLIVLMLINSKILRAPILYPSYAFKKNQLEYYQRLSSVRKSGDFEGWITFYLRSMLESAQDAHARAKQIIKLEQDLNEKIQTAPVFLKSTETAGLALEYLFFQPVTTIPEMSRALNKAYNTTSNILKLFCEFGFVAADDSGKRGKTYRFTAYLDLL